MSVFQTTKNSQAFWEIMTGFFLILIAATSAFLAFSSFHRNTLKSYSISAIFSRVDGLEIGSDVRLSGVKVGAVQKLFIDPKTWQAHAIFSLENRVKLPIDSNAIITSDSLLGGKYISLVPGADDKILKANETISDTQGTVSLEELITKFVFSSEDKKSTTSSPQNS
ncbi:outer membrane lipid asymmetry maintenance protein MlaD [Acetobacteraceae bacterium]|nr:outer membrane lipid asymmetry maintenance protein MlaD [Acetobacteraceae bacterium]